MKTLKLFIIIILFIGISGKAQFWKKVIDEVEDAIDDNTGSLSNSEINAGLKEALEVGAKNSVSKASKINGYFANPKIKIPFPPEAKKVEEKVRQIGLNKEVDEFVLNLNRAAEKAAKEAVPIFINAIKELTISDGLKILNGSDNAATQYLKQNTSVALKNKFKPIVHNALQKVEITKYWTPIITTYNKVPFVQPMNPDLDEYTTQKAIDGIFILIAAEELKIRKDPLARVTDLLKKVFGD